MHPHIHTPRPPPKFIQEDLWHDNYKKCLSPINHPRGSLNRLTHLHTPERHSPPLGKHRMQKPTPQLGNIAPIEDRVYNDCMGRCTQSEYFHCILNHCSLITTVFELSRSRHSPARYMDFLPSPLNSSTIQCRVRDREGDDAEFGGSCRLMCSYPIQSKISLQLWCVTLNPSPLLGSLTAKLAIIALMHTHA